MNIEPKLAMQIGALVVENAKKDAIIEAMRVELKKRDEIIRQLNESEPELPMVKPVVDGEARNGAH